MELISIPIEANAGETVEIAVSMGRPLTQPVIVHLFTPEQYEEFTRPWECGSSSLVPLGNVAVLTNQQSERRLVFPGGRCFVCSGILPQNTRLSAHVLSQ